MLIVAAVMALSALALGAQAQGPDEPCDGPENVQATANPDGTILVEWAYEVYRAVGDGPFEEIGQTSGHNPDVPGTDRGPEDHDTSFLDTNTTVGETYRYQIQAFGPPPHLSDICGEVTVTAIPVFPTAVAAITGAGRALLAYRRLSSR
jgi:hypothetical protein